MLASRRVRSLVARGSMPYSAVTQPLPVPFSQPGTGSPTLAVQSTCVSPKRTRQEPSAWREKPRSKLMGRNASAARLEGREIEPLLGIDFARTLEEAPPGGKSYFAEPALEGRPAPLYEKAAKRRSAARGTECRHRRQKAKEAALNLRARRP